MKRFLSKQLLNILFLVLIVGGALTIYFLSRANRSEDSAQSAGASPSPGYAAKWNKADATTSAKTEAAAKAAESAASGDASVPSPSESAAPTPTPPKRPRGVPEAVFTTHLTTSELFSAQASADDPRVWTLTYGDSPEVSVSLQYTVDYGCVSSLELLFPQPQTFEKDSDSAIEQYLASAGDRISAARSEAIRALVTDLLPACDANDALSLANVRLWAEESLHISSDKDDYSQKSEGCSYLAYQSLQDEDNILVCLFFIGN